MKVFALARCSRSRAPYFITFHKTEGGLIGETARCVTEEVVTRGVFDVASHGTVTGLLPTYACPSCESRSITFCGGCHRLSCWEGSEFIVTCVWCGNRNELKLETWNLEGGTDI